jgi:hypothetical protein
LGEKERRGGEDLKIDFNKENILVANKQKKVW